MIEKTLKNSESQVPADQRAFLTYESPFLVPCTLQNSEDDFTFSFDDTGMKPFLSISEESLTDQYRLLVNCAALEEMEKEYAFSLSPDNLVYDLNLLPRVLVRDAATGKSNFLREYRALAASILCPEYAYQDYLEGGDDLFAKQQVLQEIAQLQSADALKEYLQSCYRKERSLNRRGYRWVNKKMALAARIAIPTLAVFLLAGTVFWQISVRWDIPYRDTLLQADAAYLAGNYREVSDTLARMDIDRLPLENRYMLARSYVTMEGLTAAQKQNVLDTLTLSTEDAVLNYWIKLGREDFVGAVDDAQRLGDDELLLFALIKQRVVTQNDSNLSGEEKAATIAALEDQISELQEKMQKAEEQAQAGTTDEAEPQDGTDASA